MRCGRIPVAPGDGYFAYPEFGACPPWEGCCDAPPSGGRAAELNSLSASGGRACPRPPACRQAGSAKGAPAPLYSGEHRSASWRRGRSDFAERSPIKRSFNSFFLVIFNKEKKGLKFGSESRLH